MRTSDLALATAISVSGIAIEAMQQSDSERMFFIFTKSDKLTDLVNQFWRGELRIDPLAYFNHRKTLLLPRKERDSSHQAAFVDKL